LSDVGEGNQESPFTMALSFTRKTRKTSPNLSIETHQSSAQDLDWKTRATKEELNLNEMYKKGKEKENRAEDKNEDAVSYSHFEAPPAT